MSFLSVLGKIGKGALGLLPGGGVASSILSGIGNVASGAAKGSADQRIQEAPSQIGAYNANVNATGAQDKRAALAALLGGGLQDAQVNRPMGSTIPDFSVSGGLRPSAMNQAALLSQLSKPIDPLATPQAGTAEKVLGGIGLGGTILGALGGALGNIKKTPASAYQPTQQGPQQSGINPRIFGNVRF